MPVTDPTPASFGELRTPRLLLRQWRDEDREPFAALNADPVVMRHFPSTQSRTESDAAVDRYTKGIAERGWGLWAVELTPSGEFIGFVGIQPVPGNLPFAPAVEIGWRLAAAHHGHGYATEAALASRDYAFTTAGLTEIVAMTSAGNQPSRNVMEKIGMTRDPADDFVHPNAPSDWPGRHHVLYRLGRPAD